MASFDYAGKVIIFSKKAILTYHADPKENKIRPVLSEAEIIKYINFVLIYLYFCQHRIIQNS
jgi:hypothetical protein